MQQLQLQKSNFINNQGLALMLHQLQLFISQELAFILLLQAIYWERLSAMPLLQLPWRSLSATRSSLQCCSCNCLGVVYQQSRQEGILWLLVTSKQLTAIGFLTCRGCNSLGEVNQQPEAHSNALVATTLEYSINSQRFSPMQLLQLPWSSQSTARSSLLCCCCNFLEIANQQPEALSKAAVATACE